MKTSKQKEFEAIKLAVETHGSDPKYWLSRTPQERLWAVELMRQRAYGYDENSVPKFQKVIEIATLNHYEPRTGEPENSADLPAEQS
jgi:hypothetical protein